MTFKTVLRDGESISGDMLQRILGVVGGSFGMIVPSGVGTGFSAYVPGGSTHFALTNPSGLNVSASAGWLIGQRDAGASTFDPRAFHAILDSASTVTLAANASGTTRVDTIAVRLGTDASGPAPTSDGSNLPTLVIVQGGASSALGNAPADGALYFAIGKATVLNGGGTVNAFTDLRGTSAAAMGSYRVSGAGATNVTGTGAPPVATGRFLFQAGSQVGGTSAGGDIVLTYPVPFPNGVGSVVVSIGDNVSSPWGLLVNAGGSNTLAQTYVRLYNTSTGAAIPNSALIRVNWMAFGW